MKPTESVNITWCEARRRILKEAAVLVSIWIFIGGTAVILLFTQVINVLEDWIAPLGGSTPASSSEPMATAIRNISYFLHNLSRYGTYFLIIAIFVSSALFWLSLRQILVVNCPHHDSSITGEKSNEA